MMSNEEKINLDLLDSLSEEEKKVALEILKQYSETGTSELFEELQYADFDEVPVDINTFLHDPLYLGKGLTDAEGRFTLYPYWEKCLKDIFPDNITTKYNNIVFTGAIGLGKAQPLDALVLTKDGFKKMGELTLADQVFGNDGNLHKLIGIFPQGTKKMCKVTFTDNTSAVCCEDHLWTVYNIKNQTWTTVSIKQLLNGSRNLNHAAGHRYKIPITEPINFEEKETVINSYMLGVLLGDGHVTNNVTFSSNDQEIVNNIAQCLDEGYEVRKLVAKMNYSVCKIKNTACYDKQHKTQVPVPNKYMEAIRQYNLNVTTADKYIPQDYLINSVENRIALLQGLMDTDGYVSKDGSLIEFSTISEKLKDDFVFLIQSLGGTCHVRTKLPSYKDKNGNKKYGKLCYNIGIKLPKTICPFRLSRKVNRLSEHALEPYRYIKSIDYVEDQECQCIYIDSQEHLYLTNDFIVTHNSTIAIIAILYMLYRLLCLKDPYLYYGMMPNDKLSISLMNITLENAKGVALDKMNQMILASDWFLQHGEMAGTSNLIYRPQKHIEVVLASSNNQIIGRAIFANFTDEVNFGLVANPERQKQKMMKLITQLDARMKSRFMRGTYLPTLNIIASSKDTEQSFLEEYIKNKEENNSTTTLVVDEPQWIVDSRKDSPEKFWVAVGSKMLPNELPPLNITEAEVDELRAKGYDMWRVPIGYLETFQLNIDEAICSIIGIATASSLKYIAGDRIAQTKTNAYRNPFVKDVIEVGDGKEDYLQYANFFDLSMVSETDKARPLFIHLDMSGGMSGKGGDKTGIAGVWITGKEAHTKLLTTASQLTALTENTEIMNDLHYKLAFSVSVKAPKGENISYAKNKIFVRWLRDQGFAIKSVSADTYQSTSVLQELTAEGFKTDIVTVDKVQKDATGRPVCLPYHFFKNAIYGRQITLYEKCDQLTDELINLERRGDGHVDHPKNGGKDQADAVCGALWSANKFSADGYSYSYGDNLDASLDANDFGTNEEYRKQKMISSFEEELKKIYFGASEPAEETEEHKKLREEYEFYSDLDNGIIVI